MPGKNSGEKQTNKRKTITFFRVRINQVLRKIRITRILIFSFVLMMSCFRRISPFTNDHLFVKIHTCKQWSSSNQTFQINDLIEFMSIIDIHHFSLQIIQGLMNSTSECRYISYSFPCDGISEFFANFELLGERERNLSIFDWIIQHSCAGVENMLSSAMFLWLICDWVLIGWEKNIWPIANRSFVWFTLIK